MKLEGITILLALFSLMTIVILGGLFMGMFIFEHVAQI